MTLILTAGSRDFVAQVSDRRFCMPSGLASGDEENKELIVDSAATKFAVAFTGRAEIDGQHAGVWLLEVLRQDPAIKRSLLASAQAVRTAIQRSYSRMASITQWDMLEFVFAGYDMQERNPAVILVSNFKSETFQSLASPRRQFSILMPDNRSHPFCAAGYTPALRQGVDKRVRALIKRGADPTRVRDTLVDEVRRASQDPKGGHWIGKSCMAITLMRSGEVGSTYYAGHERQEMYAPAFIHAGEPGRSAGVSFSSVEVSGSTSPIRLQLNDLRRPQRRDQT